LKIFNNIKSNLPIAISVVIICIHYIVIYKLGVNIPRYDDFRNLLSFLNDFDGSLSMFLKPSEEHRNVVARAIALIDFKLFGSLNFLHLVWVGQLFLLGFHILIYNSIILKINKWLIVPFVLINYQIASYDTALWGLVSIQHYGTMFFTATSFYFLSRNKPNIYWGFLFATLATFTFGNGFLSLIIGGFIVFRNRNNKNIIIWVVSSIVVFLVYFLNHNTPKIKYIS